MSTHRANVVIVMKVEGVQFALKPLHYLTVTSHVSCQDQHHNLLQTTILYFIVVLCLLFLLSCT